MSKINKLGKSTFVVAILSFLLVAVLAFGGTYAYFSATAGATQAGDLTVGTLSLDLKNKAGDSVTTMGNAQIAQPGQYLIGSKTWDASANEGKGAWVENKETYTFDLTGTNINSYIRIKISATLTNHGPNATDTNEDSKVTYADNKGGDKAIASDADLFQFSALSGWVKVGEWYYQGTADSDTALKVASGAESPEIALTVQVNPLVGEDRSTFFMGATATWIIQAEAIQADYVESVLSADNATVTVAELAASWDDVVSTVA